MSPILGIYASQISGHLWAPAGAYDALASFTVPSGGIASVTFSGIPQTYKHLQIRMIARTARTGTFAGLGIRVNGSTAGQNYYAQHYLSGDGSTVTSGASTPRDNMVIGDATGSSATSSVFGAFICDILDYTNTNKLTTLRTLSGADNNGSGYADFYSGLYTFTTAISSITLQDNNGTSAFAQYSSFALYGVN